MFDTHAHLADTCFDLDRHEVIDRAKSAGVNGCIIVGEHPNEAEKILEICSRYPDWAYPGLGLFPNRFNEADIKDFFQLVERKEWVCLGEIGLDTWIVEDENCRKWHEEVFIRLIEIAKQRDVPVNVHSRNCAKRVIEILIDSGHKRVHLHALEAKPSTVRLGIDAGFYFSIPTSVLHSPQKQKLACLVPLEQMLLETDSPVLGPERDMRNEPSNLLLGIQKIAELRGMSVEEIDRITELNTKKLYKLNV